MPRKKKEDPFAEAFVNAGEDIREEFDAKIVKDVIVAASKPEVEVETVTISADEVGSLDSVIKEWEVLEDIVVEHEPTSDDAIEQVAEWVEKNVENTKNVDWQKDADDWWNDVGSKMLTDNDLPVVIAAAKATIKQFDHVAYNKYINKVPCYNNEEKVKAVWLSQTMR